jgi:prepilin-type N-terminal cleavage/methylation domain-containing protein
MTTCRPIPHAHGPPRSRQHRGLTLIELMLALTITLMVAGAMSGMLSAVSAGVTDRQDTRGVMIRSSAATSKLSAYISPARAIWGVSETTVAIWLNDDRQGGGIHATEVRWLVYDPTNDVLEVRFVKFPDEWTQTARDLSDIEYPKSVSDAAVYAKYLDSGHIASLRLLDHVEGFSAKLDTSAALDARRVTFTLTFTATDGAHVATVPTTIAYHQPPVR